MAESQDYFVPRAGLEPAKGRGILRKTGQNRGNGHAARTPVFPPDRPSETQDSTHAVLREVAWDREGAWAVAVTPQRAHRMRARTIEADCLRIFRARGARVTGYSSYPPRATVVLEVPWWRAPSGGRKRSSGSGGLVPPGIKVCSAQQRHRTPQAFAEWLVELARAVTPKEINTEGGLVLEPITLTEAHAYVAQHHRHHDPDPGARFAVAVSRNREIVGVAVVGRPKARMVQIDDYTAEVTRCCTDGSRNACSMLYAASWRAARALGYRRLITYTLPAESGASLRAAGWQLIAETKGGSWNRRERPRVDKHPTQQKLRWERGEGEARHG